MLPVSETVAVNTALAWPLHNNHYLCVDEEQDVPYISSSLRMIIWARWMGLIEEESTETPPTIPVADKARDWKAICSAVPSDEWASLIEIGKRCEDERLDSIGRGLQLGMKHGVLERKQFAAGIYHATKGVRLVRRWHYRRIEAPSNYKLIELISDIVDERIKSGCRNKRYVDSEAMAQKLAARMESKRGESYEGYKCKYCSGWHVGHKQMLYRTPEGGGDR